MDRQGGKCGERIDERSEARVRAAFQRPGQQSQDGEAGVARGCRFTLKQGSRACFGWGAVALIRSACTQHDRETNVRLSLFALTSLIAYSSVIDAIDLMSDQHTVCTTFQEAGQLGMKKNMRQRRLRMEEFATQP